MTGIGRKADYVRAQGQTRKHDCHWPGCGQQVPPAKWGCKAHWYKLPLHLRRRIWAAFRPGQERDGQPGRAYIEAARAVQDWIAAQPTQPAQQTLLPPHPEEDEARLEGDARGKREGDPEGKSNG